MPLRHRLPRPELAGQVSPRETDAVAINRTLDQRPVITIGRPIAPLQEAAPGWPSRTRGSSFEMARKQADQVFRRRDTREHVALYLKAFNAWRNGEELAQLRFTSREEMFRVTRGR